MPSVFTQIIQREKPGKIIFEDQNSFCIVPARQFVNPGHVLIIPKEEVDYIFDLSDVSYHKLWTLAKDISPTLKELTGAKRIGIAVEGFSIPHAHIHLCPLYQPSELDPHRSEPWSEDDRNAFVDRIRAILTGRTD